MGKFFFRGLTSLNVVFLAAIGVACFNAPEGGQTLANLAAFLLFASVVVSVFVTAMYYGRAEKIPVDVSGGILIFFMVAFSATQSAGLAAAGFDAAAVLCWLICAASAGIGCVDVASKSSSERAVVTYCWYALTALMTGIAVSVWTGGYLSHLATEPMSEAWRLAVPIGLLLVQLGIGVGLDHAFEKDAA